MTILEPTKGGNVVEVCQPCAVPACWQCSNYTEDWPNRNQGECMTLGNKLRAMGLPVVGAVTVAQHGDVSQCGRDFRLSDSARAEIEGGMGCVVEQAV